MVQIAWMSHWCARLSCVLATLAALAIPIYKWWEVDPVMGERWASYGSVVWIILFSSVATAFLFWMIRNYIESLICDRELERHRRDQALVAKTSARVNAERDNQERITIGLASRFIQRLLES